MYSAPAAKRSNPASQDQTSSIVSFNYIHYFDLHPEENQILLFLIQVYIIFFRLTSISKTYQTKHFWSIVKTSLKTPLRIFLLLPEFPFPSELGCKGNWNVFSQAKNFLK